MPDRTLKELEQIRSDIKLIKEVWDKYEGKQIRHKWFDGKSIAEEKKELKRGLISELELLDISDRVKSCEGKKIIEIALDDLSDNNYHTFIPPATSIIRDSSIARPVNNLSLDEIYNKLRLNPLGKTINKELDNIVGRGCIPIAHNHSLLEEAKALAFNSNQISLSNQIKEKNQQVSKIPSL